MTKFELNHEGYYRDCNRGNLPAVAGIYIVYRCIPNKTNNTIDIKEILYIGETENMRKRHNGTAGKPSKHEHYDDFVKEAGGEENICYGWIPLPKYSEEERKWIQDALIHMQQPPVNDASKQHYNHPAAEIRIYGAPDVWKMKHFAHPFNYSDELERKNLWESEL